MRTFILKVYGHMTPVCFEGELWDCGSEVEAGTQAVSEMLYYILHTAY